MRLYLAGPLFTEAERTFNRTLAERLEADGHIVSLPQRDTPEPEGPERGHRIFLVNLAGLTSAEVVVAVCDGPQVDDGTAWEIGYAYARGIPVYGLRTDPRITQRREEPINLMILEGLRALVPSVDALRSVLRDHCA
jgi:nucleoside 2-deoxyribosyltransferase